MARSLALVGGGWGFPRKGSWMWLEPLGVPFDALGMSVGPDQGAEEDEWDSKRTSITVQTSPSLLPGQCGVSSLPLMPSAAFHSSHVSCGVQSVFSFWKNIRLCYLSLSLPTTQSQVQLSSFYEPLGFSFCLWVELCVSLLHHVFRFSFLLSNSSRYVIKLLMGRGLYILSWIYTCV